MLAAYLEHVDKIGGKSQAQRDGMRFDIEIAHEHQLVVGVFPDELPPVDVDQLAVQRRAIRVNHIWIGQIDGQQRIVLSGIGAQEQRPVTVHAQLQLR